MPKLHIPPPPGVPYIPFKQHTTEGRHYGKKIALWIGGVVFAGILAVVGWFPSNESVIRRDLRLGDSQLIIFDPQTGDMGTVLAIASISEPTKRALAEQHAWDDVTTSWGSSIPWFPDSVMSSAFDPIVSNARDMRKTVKLHTRHETARWTYNLILDDGNNIVWIVRNR